MKGIFHMGQTMKNNFDFPVLTTQQLTTTLPLIMMECSHHEMEMSITPFSLAELLMQADEMHYFCTRPRPEIKACGISYRFL